LQNYIKAKGEYEKDYRSLGEEGALAYNLWSQVAGQRNVNGILEFSAIKYLLYLHIKEEIIADEDEFKFFRLILGIENKIQELRQEGKGKAKGYNA